MGRRRGGSAGNGGHATAPAQSHYYQVGFEYEYRDPDTDIVENYMAGARSVLRLRAARIRVKYLTTGETVRLYQLYYDTNPDPAGYRSMLNAVTLDQLPDHPGQTFAYAPANAGYTTVSYPPRPDVDIHLRLTEVNGGNRTDVIQTLLDMNGDGVVDLVQANHHAPNDGTWLVYLGSTTGGLFLVHLAVDRRAGAADLLCTRRQTPGRRL